MFQYALLVGVAKKKNCKVVIPENLMLGFDLTAEMVPGSELGSGRPTYREKGAGFHFDKEVFDCDPNTDFHGYFQSYRYFQHAEAEVRREFTFVPEVEPYAFEWLEKIQDFAAGRTVVAVHARRGDYLHFGGRFTPFTETYFRRARKAIGVTAPAYVIFSDDPVWVKANSPNDDLFILDEPDEFVILSVASKCPHLICSASSFSWWGAWLNLARDKRIVIPSPWYGPTYEYPESGNQRSPEDWIRVNPREEE
jgi:hypothetical protein